nr:MAG TPA: hypothetical protein [Caudoviricetes sp.]
MFSMLGNLFNNGAGQIGSQVATNVLGQAGQQLSSQALNQGLMEVLRNVGQQSGNALASQGAASIASQFGSRLGADLGQRMAQGVALNGLSKLGQQAANIVANGGSNTLAGIMNSSNILQGLGEKANQAQGTLSKAWDWLTNPTEKGFTTRIGVDQFGRQVIEKVPVEGTSRLGTLMNGAMTAGDLYTKYQQYKDSKRNNELAYQSNKYGFDRTKTENARLDRQRANITSSYQNGAVI